MVRVDSGSRILIYQGFRYFFYDIAKKENLFEFRYLTQMLYLRPLENQEEKNEEDREHFFMFDCSDYDVMFGVTMTAKQIRGGFQTIDPDKLHKQYKMWSKKRSDFITGAKSVDVSKRESVVGSLARQPISTAGC